MFVVVWLNQKDYEPFGSAGAAVVLKTNRKDYEHAGPTGKFWLVGLEGPGGAGPIQVVRRENSAGAAVVLKTNRKDYEHAGPTGKFWLGGLERPAPAGTCVPRCRGLRFTTRGGEMDGYSVTVRWGITRA